MDESNLETIKCVNIPTKTGYVNLQSLGTIREEESNGKLFRKNANQAAYITAEIDGMSASHAMQNIKKELGKMNFEKGYGFSFPHELEVM